MRVYSAAEVHAALPWEALAAAIERAFVAGAAVAQRHVHALAPHDTLLLMPAWNDAAVITKIVTVVPGAPHTVQATLVALDRATGAPRAVLDGEAVTLRRTAATSALAARYLARDDAQNLLVVGAGRLAPHLACAHYALRPSLRRVFVWADRKRRASSELRISRDSPRLIHTLTPMTP